MKVVQVTTSSKGGAGIAALRLHRALRQQGVRSAYISRDRTINFDDKEIEDPFFRYQRPSALKKILRKLRATFNPTQAQKFKQALAGLESGMGYEIITLPFSSLNLETHPLIAEADLVNLHWVGQLLDYQRFFAVFEKPIVWTLHDMNPFMGIFHYRGDAAQNPMAKSFNDEVAGIKRKAVEKIKKGAIVSPSNWLLEAANISGVFDHFQERISIPNGIDLDVFDPLSDPTLRDRFSIKENENVLLFNSATLDNPRKGMDLMLEAFEKLSIPITLLMLGKGKVETSNKAVKIIPLGFMDNAAEISACYAASDALLLPSREDNLPNTMLEAFATGTPVISFATGGMKEHITYGVNGVLAEEISGAALAKAIEDLFTNVENYDAKKIRNYAEENFSLSIQAKAYTKVYNHLLKE
jgi:glycosyltransferase involved in cell wall biosynthesis